MQIIISLILLSQSVWAHIDRTQAPACRFTLTAPGVKVGIHLLEMSRGNWDVYLLADNPRYATIFRYVARDGSSSHVEVVYRKGQDVNRDLVSLQLLDTILSQGLDANRKIRVVQVIGIEGKKMILEDVRGTSIRTLYEQNVALRTNYWNRMWDGLNIVAGALMDYSRRPENRNVFEFNENFVRVDNMKKWPSELPSLPELRVPYQMRVSQKARWSLGNLVFHAENVLYEPDGSMVIIGPIQFR